MSKMTDKVSYLKGLAAGMKLNMEKDTNKLLMEVLGVMGEMAEEMEAVSQAQEELNEYVESIDDDLADLEEAIFEDDEDYEPVEDEDEDELDGEELISYACPNCGHELQFRASDVDFDEDYLCPACGKPVFPELEEDEDAPEGDEDND